MDIEDWSNDCWKFSFANTEINYNLNKIIIEDSYCFFNTILPYCSIVVYYITDLRMYTER